ncbi:MAG: corrinoid protein [Caldilineaceae bacterium]|nr:corrinoid protein [Caldilineaceae bacterium]
MDTIDMIFDGVVSGNQGMVEENVRTALAEGIPAKEILDDGLVDAMAEVGDRFEEGRYFVPEMLVAARAMKSGLAILREKLVEGNVQPAGKVVIGTVQGDIHDIGKNLVGMMLEGAGFEIIDLGVNVSPTTFADAAKTADIVAMSALLTTTMPNMVKVMDELKKSDVRGRVKVIVGGAPVTDDFAKRIGADGFAKDASQAATLAASLVGAG